MAMYVSYYAPGFDPSAPAKNRAEAYDTESKTYTSWDPDGKQMEKRTMSADELTAYAPSDAGA